MNIAVSGNRGSCLSQRLSEGTYLVAVANGFGRIAGEGIAPLALSRLRAEIEGRIRRGLLRRSSLRTRSVTTALASVFAKINADLHARSTSHDDYVTAGCSMTAGLLIGDRAYLAHVGTTAAYLARGGYAVALTKTDAFDAEGALPVLTRALGANTSIETGVCAFALSDGDSLVLTGHRLREPQDRRRLAECLSYGAQSGASGDQMLVIRYEGPERDAQGATRRAAHFAPSVLTGILGTMLFYALLCIR